MITTLLVAAAVMSSAENKVVLGKLGQVTETTRIYVAPSTSSKSYAIKEFDYVVVLPMNEQWMKVLLNNRKYGYIRADLIAKLPYEVCANSPGRSTNYSTASRSAAGRMVYGSGRNAVAAKYALNFIGTPYVWGGTDVNNGVDCSGLVQKMFGAIGVNLPRTAAEQVRVGQPVTKLEDLKAGDRLYFWDKKRGKVGHTGIYLGNGYFVHSSTNHKGVATDYLNTPHWLAILVAARRS
jgi:cell wall-associated NlpC family hydrolase